MNGKVKWFNSTKGFGFIGGDNGQDYFVHHTGITGPGYKTVAQGDCITFDELQTDKGKKAVNVRAAATPAVQPR
jgi:CspA family cold shock protein